MRHPFDDVWVQPAAGDAGTALGAALQLSRRRGQRPRPHHRGPRPGLERRRAGGGCDAPRCRSPPPRTSPTRSADVLAADGVVAWFDGRSEYGPRALGQRSLLAHPGRAENLERLNDVKGREQFRPVAPMVLAERAADIFTDGPLPSPYMLFVHDVRPGGANASRPSSTSTAPRASRPSTPQLPRVAALLRAFEAPHRPARRRQHQPQHRRPADGRRPPGRARAVRVRARRRRWSSGRTWCGGRPSPRRRP